MIRVTADSNIYISAFNFGGHPLRLMEMAIDGEIVLASSASIVTEVRRVLHTKFNWAIADVNRAEEFIIGVTETIRTGAPRIAVVKDDPDDNRVLECAIDSESNYLVTGDKHLLNLGRYENIRIVKVATFIEKMGGQTAQL